MKRRFFRYIPENDFQIIKKVNKMELVFATNNQHKLSEVSAMLGDRIVLRSLKDIECFEERFLIFLNS